MNWRSIFPTQNTNKASCLLLFVGVAAILTATTHVWCLNASAQEAAEPAVKAASTKDATFKTKVQPLLKKLCQRCHNAENMESGIDLEQFNGPLKGRRLFLFRDVLRQVSEGAMPPEDELQPTAAERRVLTEWIQQSLNEARAQDQAKNGSVRRLTVSQYRNTLRDLLGLQEDLTGVLPPDSASKEGFVNNDQTMLLSPLLIESYLNIAEKALDLCIVDEGQKPVVQNFRMDFGAAINPKPYPDKLILGANSHLLKNQDFVVTELQPDKPFDYQSFAMQRKFRFIEGYEGNATVRGWREFDSIYHAVFACMRGTDGYPLGQAYQAAPGGLLLRPAIPSSELFRVSSTYGPNANFKVSLRELPEQGDFRVTVTAARYDDGLLLEAGTPLQRETEAMADLQEASTATVTISEEGIYQVDVHFVPSEKPALLSLQLGDRHFSGMLKRPKSQTEEKDGDTPAEQGAAFLLVRLKAGQLSLMTEYANDQSLHRIALSRIDENTDAAQRFTAFEKRPLSLGVHVGLRRDCGSTLTSVGKPQTVSSVEPKQFVFEGAINNFPSPDVEKNNPNYLAGFREIGVRSEYTDGRDMPRLLIKSVEFEGPYYTTWPPETHQRIFIDSTNKNHPPTYAREVIRAFATRAFRRPISSTETQAILAVWESSLANSGNFQQSIKDALLVVLTSPQFLFLIENSSTPQPEDLTPHELASKLSYFLWNTAPDNRLLELAEKGSLQQSLDVEVERLIADERFSQFVSEFASQWLSLDKLDVVEIDRKRYPKLTRDTKTQLRLEPIRTLEHLLRQNLPVRNLVQSDIIVANDVVADYYGLSSQSESGFQFLPIQHRDANLGGVLSQAGILAGLSDGRESNPVKRGAWFARKIIAQPPDDPPPNVPELMDDDDEELTLRQKLERHRNQKGCANCHAGIDPWGIPFQQFDAGGLFQHGKNIDASSTLPDETEVQDLNELKAYLIKERIDRVAFSFMKHLATYAVGRSLSYNEVVFLEEQGLKLKSRDYPMRDMIHFIVRSDMFLKK